MALYIQFLKNARAVPIVYTLDTHHSLPSFSETVTLYEDLNNEWVSENQNVANHWSFSLGRSRLWQCPQAHSLLLNPDQRNSLHRRRPTRLRLALMRGRAVGSRTLIRQKKKHRKVQRKKIKENVAKSRRSRQKAAAFSGMAPVACFDLKCPFLI